MHIADELVKEFESKTIFSFDLPLIGNLPVYESTIITWVIMAFLMILTLVFVRNLKVVPDRKQVVIEYCVGFINKFFYDTFGEAGKRYIPYLGTVFIYLICANIIGVFGIKPPTKELNVTAGLALMSIVLVEYSGIHAHKVGGYIKHFGKPMAIMIPFNILELAIRPLSLCLRLFGNIFGAFVIMELIKIALMSTPIPPIIVPVVFGLYFDLFDGILQAYIFVFLTSIFIAEKIEHVH